MNIQKYKEFSTIKNINGIDAFKLKAIVYKTLQTLKMLPRFLNYPFDEFLKFLKNLNDDDLTEILFNAFEFSNLEKNELSFLLKFTIKDDKLLDDKDIENMELNEMILRMIAITKRILKKFILIDLDLEKREKDIENLKIKELKGLKSIKIFQIVLNIILFIKMLPKFLDKSFEDILDILKTYENRELIEFFLKNLSFVNLGDDFNDFIELIKFTKNNQNQEISKEEIKGMSVFDLENRIVKVILEILSIEIFTLTENDKNYLKKHSINLYEEIINVKGFEYKLDDICNIIAFQKANDEKYKEFLLKNNN